MFENFEMAPPDPILSLNEGFRLDQRGGKINLGAGVYQNEAGETPVLASVKEAERRLLAGERSKSYLPIEGRLELLPLIQEMVFGAGSPVLAAQRVICAQTPGGTGALRVMAAMLASKRPEPTVWLSEPTWVNHPKIMHDAGLTFRNYPYFKADVDALAFDELMSCLRQIPGGDVIVLQGTCHNPSGVDPTAEQWLEIFAVIEERGILPWIDLAYQGFAIGLEEDAWTVRELAGRVPELVVCSSFSKTLGLYSERVGGLSILLDSNAAAPAAMSQVKSQVRGIYSSPPSHGGAIASTVLGDAELRRQWMDELAGMRQRIARMRELLVAGLESHGVRLKPGGNEFIVRQKGMFSFTGLSPQQVTALRERFGVYVVGSGRINVAGLTESNMDRFCAAVAAVLA